MGARWLAALAGSLALHASVIIAVGTGTAAARQAPAHGGTLSVWLRAPRPAPPEAGSGLPQVPEPESAAVSESVMPAEAPAANAPAGARDDGSGRRAPAYSPTSMLTRSPRPLAEPSFPPVDASLAGRVLVELYVSASGEVDEAAVIESDVPEAVGLGMRDAFKALRFAPGEIQGRPTAARMRIEVSVGAAQ